jgi:hypothetical protein
MPIELGCEGQEVGEQRCALGHRRGPSEDRIWKFQVVSQS